MHSWFSLCGPGTKYFSGYISRWMHWYCGR